MQEGAQSFPTLSRGTTVSDAQGPTSPETLQTESFWMFMEASLYWHDCLSHWPLATDLTSSPSLFSRGQRDGTESYNPPITWLVLLATNLHP